MTFAEAITAGFRNYARFDGRASRSEFWWFILFGALGHIALNSLNVFTTNGTIMMGSSLSGLWSVVLLLPTLGLSVRRLRDAGRQWVELFWLLLPVAGVIVLIVHLCDAPVADREPSQLSEAGGSVHA